MMMLHSIRFDCLLFGCIMSQFAMCADASCSQGHASDAESPDESAETYVLYPLLASNLMQSLKMPFFCLPFTIG